MRSFWSEPFLWIHLAGIAVVPIALQLVWVGFAIGDPVLPYWLELLLVGAIGILPILWMQWNKPFDIFSLLIIALRPDALTLQQQRLLSLFKRSQQRLLALLTAILMALVLWQLYRWSPLVAVVASFLPQWRILGLSIAAVGLLVSNLFIQVPVSVLGVLSASEEQFETIEPCTPEKIRQYFTIPGFRVKKILPNTEISAES